MDSLETDGRSVLFVSVDCLRADHTGCYGYDRPTTPNIDTLAEDGVVYRNSYANCPQTRWAMQSLHTGVCAHAVEGLGIPDTPGVALAEQFQKAGYATGGFANNGFVSRDYNYHQGFDTYRSVSHFSREKSLIKRLGDQVDRLVTSPIIRSKVYTPLVELLRSTEGTVTTGDYRESVTDEDVTDSAVDWIGDRVTNDEPFFAWLHLMDAHTPYSRWDDHLAAVRGDTDVEHVVRPHDQITVGEEPPEAVIDAYDAGIRSADEQIGRVLEAVPDDTVVVITGDHGESFGRYADFHSGKVYSTFTQVPIVVRAPALGSGTVDEYPVQHLDIPPTLLTAAGITVPEWMSGEPLQNVDRDDDFPVHFCVTNDEGSDIVGIRCGEWKYMEPKHGETGLFRVPHMGAEAEEIGDEQSEIRDQLSSRIRTHEREWADHSLGYGTDPLSDGQDDLSETVEENLEELGYLE